MREIRLQHLVDRFHLEVVAGERALDGPIESDDIHRPGLEFTGYLDYFPKERVQILGRQEITYLHSLTREQRDMRIGAVVAMKPPCFVITRGQAGLDYFTLYCNKYEVPLLRTEQKTTSFISRLNSYLERELAPEETLHAVCMNIFGVGIILRGASGAIAWFLTISYCSKRLDPKP
jgi:HPr kinase/phosphorylase